MINKELRHWNNIYSTKMENEVSWYQPYPATSMKSIEQFNLSLDANIIDVGGGDSHLVDVLLEKGFQNIWVLDISAIALEKAKQRLGKNADKVHWVVADITTFESPVQFDCWHDRAAFHFLTNEALIDKYISIAKTSIKPNGYMVLGTFSETGPLTCSGLKIKRYSEASLSATMETVFEKINCITEDHETPFNTTQNFLFCSFKKL